jgi:inner membrane protein involved in colicin E2 resistance
MSLVVVFIPLYLTLGRIVERHRDYVYLLYNLPNSTTLAQKIVVGSVLPIIKILVIEDYKLDSTFLHVAFRSQSLLKSTSDKTGSDTNWRTGEDDQRGVNGSQSKFHEGTQPMSKNQPNVSLF